MQNILRNKFSKNQVLDPKNGVKTIFLKLYYFHIKKWGATSKKKTTNGVFFLFFDDKNYKTQIFPKLGIRSETSIKKDISKTSTFREKYEVLYPDLKNFTWK